ncbi:hypothetical protein ACS0TY_030795 [Phlomoides rotata]
MYSREFQRMMEEDCGNVSEKKRRLGVEQVKALEKTFEVENKLEPERKVKLAEELGLQPRQVAVWFQNRRARWKTKQLERDYGVLKANYDALKLNFHKLHSDNQSLLKQIRELKSKVDEEEEPKVEICGEELKNVEMASVFGDFKDGSSDSDSSAILNEDNNNNNTINQESPRQKFFNEKFQFSDADQPQFVKIEEHNFLGEESCTTFFSDDQAPTLHWYCSDQWN